MHKINRFRAWWQGKRVGGVVAAVALVGVVVGALVVGIVAAVKENHGAKQGHASTATVTQTVTVTATREYAEDSLPDEFYRWVDAHPGADLFGPHGGANAYAPGHHGCYAATSGSASLVMCPDGYRADK